MKTKIINLDYVGEYKYTDENGKTLFTVEKNPYINSCNKCASTNIKDKGSYSKCMECGNEVNDSILLHE